MAAFAALGGAGLDAEAQRHIFASRTGSTRKICSTSPKAASPASNVAVTAGPLAAGAASALTQAQIAVAAQPITEMG